MRAVLALVGFAAMLSSAQASCADVKQRVSCNPYQLVQPNISKAEMCSAMGCCFDNSSQDCFYASNGASQIKKVHMIQASHFDAGFADTLVGIVNLWFHTHFPRALSLGLELEAMGGPMQMRFMTQSWLVSLFLNCPPNVGIQCPTAEQQANFTQAVSKGFLTWHAFPHNAELGSADASLIEFGVQMTHDLDSHYSVRNKTVVSQRDVPGAPRSAMLPFAKQGVRAFSVGVNTASSSPVVPRAFVWRDEPSGTNTLTLYHPFGYGGFDKTDAIILPGLDEVAILAWRGDNQGPATSVKEMKTWWDQAASEFPGAEVITSDFEQFVDAVEAANVTHLLPVITSEIGDTWNYGLPTDPVKRAYGHAAMDARNACLQSGACSDAGHGEPGTGMTALYNFSRLLVKLPEHTDGKDVKTFLHDDVNWTNPQLQAALPDANYQDMIASWEEQRAFCVFHPMRALLQQWVPQGQRDQAALALADRIFTEFLDIDDGQAAERGGLHVPTRLRRQHARSPSLWAAARSAALLDDGGRSSSGCSGPTQAQVGPYSIAWNATTGAVTSFRRGSEADWASDDRPLLSLQYLTYSAADYSQFIFNYSSEHPPPSYLPKDFGKPNSSGVHIDATTSLLAASCPSPGSSLQLRLLIDRNASNDNQPLGVDLHKDYGAPAVAVLTLQAPPAGCSAASSPCPLSVSLQLVNKTSTKLPEALFLRFNPVPTTANQQAQAAALGWRFTANNAVHGTDPTDVQLGGNRYMHAVQGPLWLQRSHDGLCVNLIDARVASFGQPRGLPTPIGDVDGSPASDIQKNGAAVYLLGNLWGTNYPQFVDVFGETTTLSFRLQLDARSPLSSC